MTSPLRTRRDYGSFNEKSSAEIDFQTSPPKTLQLPWGNPPKPYLWEAALLSVKTNFHGFNVFKYRVESPLIRSDKAITLFIQTKVGNRLWVMAHIFVGETEVGVVKKELPPWSIESVLKELWDSTMGKREKFLKPNVKVASTNISFHAPAPRKLPLPWGDPPKPYLWQADLDTEKPSRLYRVLVYKVKSPLMKDNYEDLLIALRVRKDNPHYIFAHLGYSFSTAPRIIAEVLFTEQGWTLEGVLKKLWQICINRGLSDFLKPNVKVASANVGFYGKPPKTLSLPWGYPPKPYLWQADLDTDNPTKVYRVLVYKVKSPLIKEGEELHVVIEIKWDDSDYFRVKLFSSLSTAPQIIADVLFTRRGWTLEGALKTLWANKTNSNFLKPNVKVASSTIRFRDPAPKTLALPWGDPPKPFLWNTQLKKDLTYGGNRVFTYEIKSPLIAEGLKMEAFFQLKEGEAWVSAAIYVKRLNAKQGESHSESVAEFRVYNAWDLNDVLRELWKRLPRNFLKPVKVASAGGKYGYTKKVQNDCERAIAQLKKFCTKICVKQQSKGDKHLEFYRKHAEKTESPFTKAIVQCNKDIYNEALSKIATSMYGFDERTVKVCLANLNAVQMQSASLINRLLARKTSNSEQIKAYLKEHIEQTGCVWSMCLEACL